MVYGEIDFNTKKELIQAIKDGKQISIFQIGPFAANCPKNGRVVIEGPHYPRPHKWYAEAEVKDGIIQKVK